MLAQKTRWNFPVSSPFPPRGCHLLVITMMDYILSQLGWRILRSSVPLSSQGGDVRSHPARDDTVYDSPQKR